MPDTATTGRALVRICDLHQGDRISGTGDQEPTATVHTWDGSNLTLQYDAANLPDPVTLHLVDYMDLVARYENGYIVACGMAFNHPEAAADHEWTCGACAGAMEERDV